MRSVCVCGGNVRPDALSETPELAPSWCPPLCGQMLEWQRALSACGLSQWVSSLEETSGAGGYSLLVGSWLLLPRESPFPRRNWFGLVAGSPEWGVKPVQMDRSGFSSSLGSFMTGSKLLNLPSLFSSSVK